MLLKYDWLGQLFRDKGCKVCLNIENKVNYEYDIVLTIGDFVEIIECDLRLRDDWPHCISDHYSFVKKYNGSYSVPIDKWELACFIIDHKYNLYSKIADFFNRDEDVVDQSGFE